MYTIRYGKIYNYDEDRGDDSWTNDDFLIASSYFATYVHLGYSEELSYSLSFMAVSIYIHPELKYSEEHSKLLKMINHVETA